MAETIIRCAELSEAEQEPLAGSAPQVDIWLMLEVRSAWLPKAPADNALAKPLNQWLNETIERCAQQGKKLRPQFIKRRSTPAEPLSLFIASSQGLYTQQFETFQDLLDLDVMEVPLEPNPEPVYFVCTHGQRDVCCSKLGIPVWQALEAAFPGQVWQTTHLGGHRFAANVLVLPEGLLLGRMRAENVLATVKSVQNGIIPLANFRGRSYLPVAAQASETKLVGRYQALLSVSTETVTFLSDHGEEVIDIPQLEEREVLASCGDENRSLKLVFA